MSKTLFGGGGKPEGMDELEEGFAFEFPANPGPMLSVTFDMGDPMQHYTYEMMHQAHYLHSALEEFSLVLRNIEKTGEHPRQDRQLTSKEREVVSVMRDMFWETVKESGAEL